MKTTVSRKGHIALPAELRRQDRIRSGQRFEIVRLKAGEYLLKTPEPSENEGLVDWLLACPETGWYESIPSESTDTGRS